MYAIAVTLHAIAVVDHARLCDRVAFLVELFILPSSCLNSVTKGRERLLIVFGVLTVLKLLYTDTDLTSQRFKLKLVNILKINLGSHRI
jgi:hypothetical protein